MKIRGTDWSFFDESLGQGQVTTFLKFGQKMWPHSVVYVCPKCGLSWAKIHVALEPWQPIARYCPQHGAGLILPYRIDPHIEIPGLALQHEIRMIQRLSNPARYDTALISRGQKL